MASGLEAFVDRILVFEKLLPAWAIIKQITMPMDDSVHGDIEVITSDGRVILGTLKGFDQTINLILDLSHERVYSTTSGVEQVPLGLYIVRGDNVAVIGEVDTETDAQMDFSKIRGEPLNPVVH